MYRPSRRLKSSMINGERHPVNVAIARSLCHLCMPDWDENFEIVKRTWIEIANFTTGRAPIFPRLPIWPSVQNLSSKMRIGTARALLIFCSGDTRCGGC